MERDVSLTSGAKAAEALRRLGHSVTCVDMFLGETEPKAAISNTAPDLAALRASRPGTSRVGDDVFALCQAADLVFIALHGTDGEDGKIQAAFDLLGVKYTGTGQLGSALAMNKAVAKTLMAQADVTVARSVTVTRRDTFELAASVGFPCVVKPVSGGSSVGTSVVGSMDELEVALVDAWAYDEFAMVEQFIKGRECSVGVLAERALPVIEIRPLQGFFDYENKYQDDMTLEICPGEFDADTTARLQAAALDVFRALKLEVYSRMDFIVTDDGELYCLEANTLPGLTPASLMPKEAVADGMTYDDFIAAIVAESLKKYGDA